MFEAIRTKTAKKHNEHLLQKDIQISLRRVEHRKMNKIKPIPTARELIAIEIRMISYIDLS